MSALLRHFLFDAYERRPFDRPEADFKDYPIQIDDQDDTDSLEEFCTIFIVVRNKGNFEMELSGRIPITKEIIDLAEIYNGYADQALGKIVVNLNIQQVEAVTDLAGKVRTTAFMGSMVNNPNWHRVSARTIGSLHRFVRIIKEYQRLRGITA